MFNLQSNKNATKCDKKSKNMRTTYNNFKYNFYRLINIFVSLSSIHLFIVLLSLSKKNT